MKLLLLLVIIFVLWYLFRNNGIEPFSQFAPIDWKKQSADQCAALKEEAKEIQATLQSCTAADIYGQRDNINNKTACIDAVNRQIFNERENKSWCASAEGKKTEDKEMLGAQPSEIVSLVSKLPDKDRLTGGNLPDKDRLTGGNLPDKDRLTGGNLPIIVPAAPTVEPKAVNDKSSVVTKSVTTEKKMELIASELLAVKPADMMGVTPVGGVLEKNFSLIDSMGFNGRDMAKAYASY